MVKYNGLQWKADVPENFFFVCNLGFCIKITKQKRFAISVAYLKVLSSHLNWEA
jgi:hypothetical protein